MGVLSNCEPKKVFEYFEMLCSVPHGSGNTKQVSDLVAGFAKEHGLRYIQDALNNVIIFKDATPGYEGAEPIILQGHMDMVCAKEDDCAVNMATEAVPVATDGEWVFAKGTSLGADNGAAVALVLALLDDETLAHPPIEAVFTIDEETGMDGARELDVSVLKGRKLLNLDSEEEGVFTVSCAGGVRADCRVPAVWENVGEDCVCRHLLIAGLVGGHSGGDINLGRGSSNQLMGRFLYRAAEKTELRLAALSGGKLDNVIPSRTESSVVLPKSQADAFDALVQEYDAMYRAELATADPGVCFTAEEAALPEKAVTHAVTRDMCFALLAVPFHVQAMDPDIPNHVRTSLNMGTLHLEQDALCFGFAVRSSLETQKAMLVERLQAVLERAGGSVSTRSPYPGWIFKKESPFRDMVLRVYEQVSGHEGKIHATHGGLECGLFYSRIPGLDCLSCGPDMHDVHSPRERLNVASIGRIYALLKEVLRECK